MHPIKSERKFVEEIEERELRNTEHFERKCQTRPHVEEKEVHDKLSSDLEDDILAFTHKEDAYEGERYNIVINRSNKYYLIVGVSFLNSNLNIVTAFITRKEKGEPKELAERWG